MNSIAKKIAILLALYFIVACSDSTKSSKKNVDKTLGQKKNNPVTLDEHQEMVQRLRRIYDLTEPEKNRYINTERVQWLSELEKNAKGFDLLRIRFTKAFELLASGDTEQAILETEFLNDLINKGKFKPGVEGVEKTTALLALCYMRLGEQQNCIYNHNDEACILPISKKAQHVKKEGSQKAISVYMKLLEQYPNNYTYRWLLNVAHMTLGQYPNHVPKRYLIPENSFTSDYQIPKFKDIASQLSVDVSALAGGLVFDDLDGDNYIDILCSSWGMLDQIRFIKNMGDGTFEDRTDEANLRGITGGLNMVHGDYNNDGFPDIFVLRGAWIGEGKHPNSLLKNQGDGTFKDVTKSAGLLSFHPTQTASWGDYNNDGWLDLFIGNESTEYAGNHPCELYKNQGDGTFKNVAKESGLNLTVFTKGVVWGDYDNDNDPDLYVSVIGSKNFLFRNDGLKNNGTWEFTDVTQVANVINPVESFPAWFFDYNNDGWLDLFVAGYSLTAWNDYAGLTARDYLGNTPDEAQSKLYLNKKNGTFKDMTDSVGLNKILLTMGCNYGDLDNDGWLDFYLGTGEPDFQAIIPNRMFRNNMGLSFQDVTTSGGFGHIQKGHGVGFSDLDNDGDQDIYSVMGGAYDGDIYQNVLFENPGSGNSWITLILEGTNSNRLAMGTRIAVTVKDENRTRNIFSTVSSGGSFGGSTLRSEIGLEKATEIESIKINWTSGKVQTFNSLNLNSFYKIIEGQDQAELINLQEIEWKFTYNKDHDHH